MKSQKAVGRFGKVALWTSLAALCAGGSAEALSKAATTTIAVQVERHAGIVLPAPTNGVTNASFRSERTLDRPTPFGNSGSSSMILSQDPTSAISRAAHRSSDTRVEVTIFEP